MKKDSKKYEDIVEYELKALEDIKSKFFEANEKQMKLLIKGSVLGTALGIGSSTLFLSLLHLIEGFLVTEHWKTFTINLVMSAISLIVIVLVIAYFHYQIRLARDNVKMSRESIDVIEYAIKRHQYNLEQKK
jgi:uncharacterized membrane protein